MATKKTEKEAAPVQTPDTAVEQNKSLEAENEQLKAELEAMKAAQQNAKATEAAGSGDRKVKIKLPLSRTEKDDVFVGINGKTWLIKRGEEVEVPLSVAKVLERREKMLAIAMEYEAQAAAPLEELARMYK